MRVSLLTTLVALLWEGSYDVVSGAEPFVWPSNEQPTSRTSPHQLDDTMQEDFAFWERLLSRDLVSMSIVQPPTADVCFMLYQMADNNLEDFLREDNLELINSKAIRLPHLTTWVYFDGLNYPYGNPEPLPEVWEKDGSKPISMKEEGSRYLTYSHSLGKMVSDTTLQGEQDSDDPQTVTNFVVHALNDCIARNTTEYFIAFSDHGGGFSGFGGDYNVRRNLAQHNDRHTKRHLTSTNGELLSALQNALTSVQGAPDVFDVVGFDACLMMAFGALDEFDSSITKNVLASEQLEPGLGWNYQALTYASSALGMAKEFHESYLEYGETMAIVDTAKYHVFLDSLEALSSELKALLDANNDPGISTAVQRARTQTIYVYGSLVDMGSFLSELEQLCDPVAGSPLKKLLSSTQSAYTDMYVLQGVGRYQPDYTGMNVNFPSRSDYTWSNMYCPGCLDDELFENPDYATLVAPNWLAFLKSFYAPASPTFDGTVTCSKLPGMFDVSSGVEPNGTVGSPPDPNFLFYNETLISTETAISVQASVTLNADEVIALNGLKIEAGAERRGLRGLGSDGQRENYQGTRRAQEESPFFMFGGLMPSTFDGNAFTAVWDGDFYLLDEEDKTSLLYVEELGNGRAMRALVAYFPPGTLEDGGEGLLGTPIEEVVSLGGTLAELSFVAMAASAEIDFELYGSLATTDGISEITPNVGGKIVPILYVGEFPYNAVLGGLENVIFDWRVGHGIKILKVPAEQYAQQITEEFGEASVVVSLSAFDHDIYDPSDQENAVGLQETVFTITEFPTEDLPEESSSVEESPEESPEE